MFQIDVARLSVIILVLLASGMTVRSQDPTTLSPTGYLSAELRAKVERLKKDLDNGPSTKENGPERAMILWEWANAYSLAGGILPVDLTSLVGRVGGQRNTNPGGLRQLDRYIRELRLRDEQPTAIGTLSSKADDPFLPGSHVTIEQTYQFGRMPMVEGGGFFVAKHFMSNQGAYQTNNPAGDNYITIKTSNPNAKLVADTRVMAGMHGGFRGARPGLFFLLENGVLTRNDTVTITYGDRSGGSRGFKIQTFSNDAFPLPVYVDLEGRRELLTLPIQTYQVGGGPVHSVHGFAPSIVKSGEPFTVSVRSEDVYRNRASGDIPAYDVSLNGKPFSKLAAGDQPIRLLNAIKLVEPGIYRFQFKSRDGKISGKSNPVWVQSDPGLRIYWGDTHGHCGFAEGQGTPKAFFEFGREDARLDFLTHSEHDTWMDDREWQTLIDNVDKYNKDGEFVAILGYEWTVHTLRGGHHNVFFRNTNNRKRVPNQTAPVLSQLYRRLANENDLKDVLIIPHAHSSGEYRMNDPHMETLVEISSMHGNFEWFGQMYLQHGHEVGFVSASDDHLSHPGYSTPLAGGLAQPGGLAAILAPEKTRDAIFDAMKDLAAYATTGQRIILDVDVNGARMGTRSVYRNKRTVRGRVIGTAPIAEVSILKNGEVISTEDLLSDRQDKSRTGKQIFEVSFFSESDPHMRDNPRGWRPWRGTLSVQGAKLVSASSPSKSNPLTEFVSTSENDSNRVDFRLATRGSYKNVLLELDDVSDDAVIELKLDAARERPRSPAVYRKNIAIPARKIRFSLSALNAGVINSPGNVKGFKEMVTLRRIRDKLSMDHEFTFTDLEFPKPGDFYFVRVRQLDGGMAWSSPVWVGGISKRYEHEHYR